MAVPLYLLSGASLYFESLPRGFRLAAEVGFDGLEFSPTPAGAWFSPARLSALAQTHGLRLASLHPATVPLPGWGFSPAALCRLAGFAAALPGCRFVVLHTPAAGRGPAERFFRRLEVLQEALAGTEVTVALENRNRRPGEPLARYDSPDDWMALCCERGCGAVLDTAHASTLPVPLLEVYRIVRERLVNIHLSDVAALGWWGRFSYPRSTLGHHRPPGQGLLPLPALLGELGRDGYAGLITLELSPLALHFWSHKRMRHILEESLQKCRRWFGTSNLQPPTSNFQPPTSNLQPPTSDFQPPTSNLQLPTSNLQLPTSNLQPPASNFQPQLALTIDNSPNPCYNIPVRPRATTIG